MGSYGIHNQQLHFAYKRVHGGRRRGKQVSVQRGSLTKIPAGIYYMHIGLCAQSTWGWCTCVESEWERGVAGVGGIKKSGNRVWCNGVAWLDDVQLLETPT